MKQIRVSLLFIYLLSSAIAYTDDTYDNTWGIISYDTYGGVNYKENWIKPRGQWQQFFASPQPGFGAYVGWRFHPYVAAELGYEWTANKPSSFVIPNGTSLLGVTNTTGSPITIASKVRFKTGHFDLNVLLPIKGLSSGEEEGIVPEFIISGGVAGMKPSIKIQTTPSNVSTNLATFPFTSQFAPIEGRSHAVFRVGLGLQVLLLESVGARIMWRFENTSVLRGRNSGVTESAGTRVLFKDAQTLTAGLFLKF